MDALLHSVPPSYSRSSPVHTSARDSRILTGKSESVSCVVTAPFSLGPGAYKILFVSFNSLFPQSCVRCPLLECLCCTQVCCTQNPCPYCSPLLTSASASDTQTQFWLCIYKVSGSWLHNICLSPPIIFGGYGI